MNDYYNVRDLIYFTTKGIAPSYVNSSDVIVLNQKCIRNNKIDYSFAQYHDVAKTFTDSKKVEIGDILINSTGQGTAGRCAFVTQLPSEKTVIVDSHILIVRVDDFYTAGCLSYGLFSVERLLQSFLDGSTGQGEFDKQRLFNIILRLPHEKERQAVYLLLNKIDQKIELNNRINAELEAMAKTLYDYWFVQFDFPNEDGKPYKSSGGKMVYNSILKREIPEGWEIGTISEFIASSKGGDWGKETIEGKYTMPVICVRGADINGLNGSGQIEAPKRYILDKNKEKFLLPYDLVIEISGGSPTQSTGRLLLITDEMLSRFDEPLICSNFCKAISLVNHQYAYNFKYMWDSIYDSGVLFGWEGKTSGIKNLLFESFVSKYIICMPAVELVNKFFSLAEDIHKKKQNNLKENEKIIQLRDFLLPMLMNGQVTVK